MTDLILIVEDDPVFLKLTSSILSRKGYLVVIADTARSAQQILENESEKITVVILDWAIPDLSGLELLKWMRKEPKFDSIQVIMQTGMNGPEHIRQGIDAGAYYYLVKPTRPEVLLSTIRSAIRSGNNQKRLVSKLKKAENLLELLDEAYFTFKTIDQAELLAVAIANICERFDTAMLVSEILTNAVEHGNLAITYEEKTDLTNNGNLDKEIEKRLADEKYKDRIVKVSLRKEGNSMRLVIEDEGQGFEFEKFLQFDDSRMFDNHGRGIAMANSSLNVEYLNCGNKVVVNLPLKITETTLLS
jgi:DNA-binding response OmpR family regulator